MGRRDRRADDDRTLARAAAHGDRDALELLLDRHADRVVSICRGVLGRGDDALDAAQDALIAVARGIGRYDGRAAFTTWLYRVATNAALDEVRRRKRRPAPVEVVSEPLRPLATDDPEQVAARLTLIGALAELPDEYRAAVALRDLYDLDYAEIASALDIPPGTVRSRIARGRRALAARLGNPVAGGGRPTVDHDG